MRFLLEPEPEAPGTPADWARAATQAGLDGILVVSDAERPAPLVTAVVAAAAEPGLIVGAQVAIGDRHPFAVAEEIAVADLATSGRLLVVAVPAPGAAGRFDEALDLLRRALTPRPVRAVGPTWRVPGDIAGNDASREHAVRVTPSPAQIQVPLWCAGVPVTTAATRALGHLAAGDDSADAVGAAWRAVDSLAQIGAPRARRLRWSDAATVTATLRCGRAAFDQDWAVICGPPACAMAVGRAVRPRLQLDRLPEGLEELWDTDPAP
jgi:alkanesulfonate monooxygenase SsuD/methylene tetrahydromethanopterin reductase-like flavin-dependent oxidoreductase (luciferase family)